MKPLLYAIALLVAFLGGQLQAKITADLAISEGGASIGTITLELDHVNAPMATANFIGLASGQFAWIDSTTGVVCKKPYYDGIIFHRVIEGFMNQTGSQKGDGTDGPGYKFQDGAEVNNGLNHGTAYVVSMANSGLNTNGSQIFITVASATLLDGKHIVFGKATAASEALIDQINNVTVVDALGPDNTPNTGDENNLPVTELRIESVEVKFNGVVFDIFAQGLPVVSVPKLATPPIPSTTAFDFVQPAGSYFHVAYSTDLVNWSVSDNRFLGLNDTPLTSFDLPVDATGNDRQFYSPALIAYDTNFLIPSSLANKTLEVLIPAFSATEPIIFEFDSTGESAAWTWEVAGFDGTASLYSPYGPSTYSAYLVLDLPTMNPRYWQFDLLNMKSATQTDVSGSHSVNLYFNDGTSNYTGTFKLTK